MRAWIVDTPGPLESRPLRRVELPEPEPGPGEVRVRVAACGVCRTDLHLAEGDLPPAPVPRPCRATRSSAGRRRLRPGHGRGSRSATGSAIAWLRGTCGRCRCCRTGRREPVPGGPVHRVGRRRRLRRARRGARGLRLPAARRPRRRARRAAAVRRHRRLPGAAPRRAAAGRPAGHLRLRRLGPPRRPGRHRPGRDRARARPAPRQARELALELGAASAPGPPTLRLPNHSTPRCCSPRPASWCRSRCGALDRGGTLAVAGIHLTDVPSLNYARRAVPGEAAAQRHGQHPGRRRGVPAARGQRSGSCSRPSTRDRSTTPIRPWPTWPPTGSPAPPSWCPASGLRTLSCPACRPRRHACARRVWVWWGWSS